MSNGYSSFAGYGESIPPSEFDRQWTIGNVGDDYGYSQPNAFGSLVSDLWFDGVDTVSRLAVDDSSNAVVLDSAINAMWGMETEVTISVSGIGDKAHLVGIYI